MSEIINNSQQRKELLKHMILQLHAGEAPDMVRGRLVELLKSIPYGEVVEVEQELIMEGLPEEEVLQFCDIHTAVLDGHIDHSGAKFVPPGHPVDTFNKENQQLLEVVGDMEQLFGIAPYLQKKEVSDWLRKVHARLNSLMDVDKHYLRKEYLLFPFLEKLEITGPPKVMWGKHDETRALLKAAIEAVTAEGEINPEEALALTEMVFIPAVQAISDMVMKEDEILLPMAMDKLSDEDWYHIYHQTMEFGYCLYDPQVEWKPEGLDISEIEYGVKTQVQLTTGSFNIEEMEALFRTLPIDLTFVDKNDRVKFFSLGPDRVFTRNRAILGRDVRNCHPPSSVHIVDQILMDFKRGKENRASFWINFQGKFIYIEYFALRGKAGEYLGTVEFTQDLTHLRSLQGEQRLLAYMPKKTV
jgi:uncharacterized protein